MSWTLDPNRWDAYSESARLGTVTWQDEPRGYVAWCYLCNDTFAPRRTLGKAYRALLRHSVRIHEQ